MNGIAGTDVVIIEVLPYNCWLADRMKNHEIDECIKIVKFHKDNWDGIEWAIRDIEELKAGEENEQA